MINTNKYENAYSLLHDLQDKFGLKIEAPINVEKICEMLEINLTVDLELEKENIIGKIAFENDEPVIRINPIQNVYNPRKRFTIAHEIGHYCLHRDGSKFEFKDYLKSMSRTESYWDIKESEANSFAAELLMPQTLISSIGVPILDRYLNENNVKEMPGRIFVDKMATAFDVSNKAMEYRLKNIGIL